MHWDENEDSSILEGLMPAGWVAPKQVVSRQVQDTLQEAVRIAHTILHTPSERAVMQLFQVMIDRTIFEDNGAAPTIH